MRRSWRIGLALICVLTVVPGCIDGLASRSPFQRRPARVPRTVAESGPTVSEQATAWTEEADADGKSILRPTQRSGALTETGADIERSLGLSSP